MFERFTQGARDVVTGAVGYADGAGESAITEEHLLMALLDARGTKASFVLTSLGAEGWRDELSGALAETRRRGGVSQADLEALAGLGVDVDAIVARVEEAHGEGALTAGATRTRPLRRPLAPGAREVLRSALRIAAGRGDRRLGDEHLLLALTGRRGAVAEALAGCGVSYGAVERVLGEVPAG